MHLNASPGARSTARATTSALASPKCCACHASWGPTAARATTLPNAAPATQTQAQVHEVLRLPRFHACISKVLRVPRKMGAHSRARDRRQHPSPLDSSKMLPLPRKRKPRCAKYCACHDFSACIFKALRLPREMGAHSRARDNTPAL